MLHDILMIVVGIVIGTEGPIQLSRFFKFLQNRQLMREITPIEVNESKLCKGPHPWLEVPTLTEKGPGKTQVCRACGLIPSLNKMATPEAIDRIEENNAIRSVEEKIYKDFLAKEDAEIKEYFGDEIKSGVDFEKLAALHSAGMTFGTRFSVYKSGRADEIVKVLNRTDA